MHSHHTDVVNKGNFMRSIIALIIFLSMIVLGFGYPLIDSVSQDGQDTSTIIATIVGIISLIIITRNNRR